MSTVFVKPRLDEGLPVLVRMPERAFQPLPVEGALVPLDDYWHRRLRDGDVEQANPPAPPAPVEPEAEVEPAADPAPAAEAAPATSEEA